MRHVPLAAIVLGFIAAAMVVAPRTAEGAVIVVSTPTFSITGLPIAAEATFVTSTDHVLITLENLQSDPTGVAQSLSSLRFSLSTGHASGTLVSSQATERTISSTHTYSDSGLTSTGWVLGVQSGALILDDLAAGATGPAHTLLGGPADGGSYASANDSIAGNKPHTPFLARTATFELDVPGVTAGASVQSVWFGFGTTRDVGVNAGTYTPEPVTMALLAVGGLGLLRRR